MISALILTNLRLNGPTVISYLVTYDQFTSMYYSGIGEWSCVLLRSEVFLRIIFLMSVNILHLPHSLSLVKDTKSKFGVRVDHPHKQVRCT